MNKKLCGWDCDKQNYDTICIQYKRLGLEVCFVCDDNGDLGHCLVAWGIYHCNQNVQNYIVVWRSSRKKLIKKQKVLFTKFCMHFHNI